MVNNNQVMNGAMDYSNVNLFNIVKATSPSKEKNNTIKSNKSDSVEKFFTLYRASSFYCLDAYNQLKQYYFEKGESEKAISHFQTAVTLNPNKQWTSVIANSITKWTIFISHI